MTEPVTAVRVALPAEDVEKITDIAITLKELDVLRHSLGKNQRRAEYRNHYYTVVDDPIIVSLVSKGLMIKGHRGFNEKSPEHSYFHVTDEGKKFLENL